MSPDAIDADPERASAPAPGPARAPAELATGWSVRLLDDDLDVLATHPELARGIPATVPGSVHTDLLSAGIIADPDVGLAEDDQHWIGHATWAWSTRFEVDTGTRDHWEVVCRGLDTMAEVSVNGHLLASTRNMHRTVRLDVSEVVVDGSNDLEVVIRSAFDEVGRVRDAVGRLPATEAEHYPYLRKMACNFGWDWGPVLVTAALWRPVLVEGWTSARLGDVRTLATMAGDDGIVDVHVDVAADPTAPGNGAGRPPRLDLRVGVGGSTTTVEVVDGHAHATVVVAEPRRWWPVGMGDQVRHPVTIELLVDDEVVDVATRQVGFRTVEVVEEPDDRGARWAIVVNGHPVAVRGYNWIPDRPFPGSIDPDRIRRRIDQAVAGNANLLRVWGGGVFESEDFYDHCDARGVLVWQDFLFACAAYPETDEYHAEVEAEAREAITERAHHPALVLWNGNNECVWGWHDWGWQDVLGERPWGAGYYVDLLPRLVAELDPTRPYLPASPWAGSLLAPPDDDARGVSHVWNVWNEVDWVHYRDREPAFVSELGWCAPPTWATLRRAVPDGPLDLSNPGVVHRLRAMGGVAKLDRGMTAHFPAVGDDDDWLFLAQVNQARALTVAVDHLRSLDRCSGVVVWQLNDCWPVVSWSVVDGDERPKPSWYALRSAYADRRVCVQPDGTGLAVVAVNDTPRPWLADVAVRRVDVDGVVHGEVALTVRADAHGIAHLHLPPEVAVPADRRSELLVVDTANQRVTWWWAEDHELLLPPARFDGRTRMVADGMVVDVTAHSLLREVCLFPDRLLVDGHPLPVGAITDDLLVTLLPGEVHRFHVAGARPEHAGALVERPVLRAVNDIPELARRGR